MTALPQPSGSVTLVFTDIEGSTRLLEELGTAAYRDALARHRAVVRNACRRHHGYEVDYEGDAFFYAFPTAGQAVSAVGEVMIGLAGGPIRIRVGIHTGEPELDPPKYVGLDVHKAARLMASAHGGQVVLSQPTRALVDDRVPLTDLGEHRLKDIDEPVGIHQLGAERFPPLRTISNTNLPRPASSFVGRQAELAEVLSRVEQGARLVTLTGPGGSGKTRLAVEAAASLVPEFKAGVFWVGLASVRDHAVVEETIGQTLGAKDGLAAHIGGREMLLLLDNLEQVVDCAPALATLLASCPSLTLLVTSREVLRVQGEVEYPVPPLAEPEAVSLFSARSQLEPSAEVAELCTRLDNLPLAIELAAARARALSPARILERLSQRLDLLRGGRDAEARQQTLRATIEWSYGLLSEDEQQLHARLSVFSGGCTLEAAEEVAGADLDTLQSIVEKSLLRFSDDRYWMLETIREYAAERLDELAEAGEVRRRQGEWFLALAERNRPTPMGSLDEGAIAELLAEIDNLRAAMELFSALDEPAPELRLVGALFRFWETAGLVGEGRRAAERALARRTTEADTGLRLGALYAASLCAGHQADWQAAERYDEERLRIARALGDDTMVAVSLNDLGLARFASGDHESGRAFLEESRALAARTENNELVVAATNNLGDLALTRRDYSAARAFAEEAIALSPPGEPLRVYPEGTLAFALLGLGKIELAAERFRGIVDRIRRVEGPVYAVMVVEGLAAVAAARGNSVGAARLAGAAHAIRERGGFPAFGSEHELAQEVLRAGRDALGDEQWEAECTRGAEMTLDEAIAYAVEATSQAG